MCRPFIKCVQHIVECIIPFVNYDAQLYCFIRVNCKRDYAHLVKHISITDYFLFIIFVISHKVIIQTYYIYRTTEVFRYWYKYSSWKYNELFVVFYCLLDLDLVVRVSMDTLLHLANEKETIVLFKPQYIMGF